MEISGWGRYPRIEAALVDPVCQRDVLEEIAAASGEGMIPRGLGRSYGDSSLASTVLRTRRLDQFHQFDEDSGELTCAAGLSLGDLIDCLLPRGWFPPVVPGTRFVTVGGAVASDVHGKNHHLEGCFSQHVSSLQVATVTEGIVRCSRDQHPELFRATCGGMGLTGVILAVTLQLKPVSSAGIEETTWRAGNFREALELFDQHSEASYSVAWIDCAARGSALGRSVLRLGAHSATGPMERSSATRLRVPVDLPGFLMNRYSIGAFNRLYYARAGASGSRRRVDLDPYFFPLDGIHQWNRIYGRRGFMQYQFVLPQESGVSGLEAILGRISESGQGSFLAVLKAFGEANSNYLSFPIAGYTLALDFKRTPGLEALLGELDAIVLDHGGRIYLAKDARMPEAVFKRSYPAWEEFAGVRSKYGADRVFNSLQSSRLGI